MTCLVRGISVTARVIYSVVGLTLVLNSAEEV